MSTKNEELIVKIRDIGTAEDWPLMFEAADALEAATKPVTVNTVEELDALAPDSIVLDANGSIERIPVSWCCPGCNEGRFETWADRIEFPATVLHTPRQEGE